MLKLGINENIKQVENAKSQYCFFRCYPNLSCASCLKNVDARANCSLKSQFVFRMNKITRAIELNYTI